MTLTIAPNTPIAPPTSVDVGLLKVNGLDDYLQVIVDWRYGVNPSGCDDPRKLTGVLKLTKDQNGLLSIDPGHRPKVDVTREDSLMGHVEDTWLTPPMVVGLVQGLRSNIGDDFDVSGITSALIAASPRFTFRLPDCPALIPEVPVLLSV